MHQISKVCIEKKTYWNIEFYRIFIYIQKDLKLYLYAHGWFLWSWYILEQNKQIKNNSWTLHHGRSPPKPDVRRPPVVIGVLAPVHLPPDSSPLILPETPQAPPRTRDPRSSYIRRDSFYYLPESTLYQTYTGLYATRKFKIRSAESKFNVFDAIYLLKSDFKRGEGFPQNANVLYQGNDAQKGERSLKRMTLLLNANILKTRTFRLLHQSRPSIQPLQMSWWFEIMMKLRSYNYYSIIICTLGSQSAIYIITPTKPKYS